MLLPPRTTPAPIRDTTPTHSRVANARALFSACPATRRLPPLARHRRLMHPYGMEARGWIGPDAVAAGRLGPWLAMMAMEA